MAKAAISEALWESLYKVAVEIKKIAPCKYMSEKLVFGVEHPKTKELGFVSILGALSEHYAVTVYQGVSTIHKLVELYENPELHNPTFILELPQIQLSFEDRDYLGDEDYQQIQKLGLKFRGKKAWPLFRTIRPCFMPWFMESPKEAEFLLYALEQALVVCPRVYKNPEMLYDLTSKKFLIRKTTSPKNKVWTEEIREISSHEDLSDIVTLDFQQLHKLKNFKRTANIIELDYFLFPSPIHESMEEPGFMVYALLAVDHSSGTVTGYQMSSPKEDPFEELGATLASRTMAFLQEVNILPKAFYVRSSTLWNRLKPLTNALDIALVKKDNLEKVNEIRDRLTHRKNLMSLLEEDEN